MGEQILENIPNEFLIFYDSELTNSAYGDKKNVIIIK